MLYKCLFKCLSNNDVAFEITIEHVIDQMMNLIK
jgi:hypothetical protein